jgi:hypothetical protein
MTKRHLHIWSSLAGGILIYVFANETQFFVSYLLRVPSIILNHYSPISGIIVIGDEWYRLSALGVALYSISIYAIIWLVSLIRDNKHQSGTSGEDSTGQQIVIV